MNNDIIKRVCDEANYIINTKDTIRNTARVFCVSKSTVHKDIQDRLRKIDISKYNKIESIFKYHIDVRHILGGQSTKMKYLKLKHNSEG